MSTKTKDPGPDQAIGWLVAMACFFINVIMSGIARAAGVLYVALIDLYGVSRESATTPFSIRVCVRNTTDYQRITNGSINKDRADGTFFNYVMIERSSSLMVGDGSAFLLLREEGATSSRPGLSWVVALSCFFINFVLVGIARSVAVLYVALVETYGVTREEATLPFSIRVALRNLSGE
ncbi:uncharacterized protein CEXT_578761 [Caerostris extrusa]|uniref:Uncharacterized protein n=1 Tax=Caerostris extrusa TaxID=172846 RepID=A0AAV4MI40_CAEEX|nr:uncharacterized protein CEXT_578761 [Caerostris extrusa]